MLKLSIYKLQVVWYLISAVSLTSCQLAVHHEPFIQWSWDWDNFLFSNFSLSSKCRMNDYLIFQKVSHFPVVFSRIMKNCFVDAKLKSTKSYEKNFSTNANFVLTKLTSEWQFDIIDKLSSVFSVQLLKLLLQDIARWLTRLCIN